MEYLKVRNWERHQHYKDGRPVKWIKLYIALLDDFDFERLSERDQLHAIKIWLLAAKVNNKIPASAEWIGRKIGATSKVDLESLVNAGILTAYESVRNRTPGPSSALEQRRVEESREEENREEKKNHEVHGNENSFQALAASFRHAPPDPKDEDERDKRNRRFLRRYFPADPVTGKANPAVLQWMGRIPTARLDDILSEMQDTRYKVNGKDERVHWSKLDDDRRKKIVTLALNQELRR